MLGPLGGPVSEAVAHPDQQRFEVDQLRPQRIGHRPWPGRAGPGRGWASRSHSSTAARRIAGAWTEVTGAQGTVEPVLTTAIGVRVLVLASAANSGLALVGGLHPGEHLVQGDAEAVDLLGGRQRQPLVGLVQGDGRRAGAWPRPAATRPGRATCPAPPAPRPPPRRRRTGPRHLGASSRSGVIHPRSGHGRRRDDGPA